MPPVYRLHSLKIFYCGGLAKQGLARPSLVANWGCLGPRDPARPAKSRARPAAASSPAWTARGKSRTKPDAQRKGEGDRAPIPSLLVWHYRSAASWLWHRLRGSCGVPRPSLADYVAGTGVHGRGSLRRSCILPAIFRRSARWQLVVGHRSGAKLVPNVAGPPRTIHASRHAEGSSVCSVECSWSC